MIVIGAEPSLLTCTCRTAPAAPGARFVLSLIGTDRPGLVHSVSAALAELDVARINPVGGALRLGVLGGTLLSGGVEMATGQLFACLGGTEQGRTSGTLGAAIVAELKGENLAVVGISRPRPPYHQRRLLGPLSLPCCGCD